MKVILIFIVIVTFSLYGQSFQNEHFEYIKTINIDKRLLLTYCLDFSVNEVEKFVISDACNNEVYLINEKGKYCRTLSPENCNTGIEFLPYYAEFTKYNEIIVLASMPWAYRFDKEGNCIGMVNPSFNGADRILSFSDKLVSIRINDLNKNDLANISFLDRNFKEIKRFGIFPKFNNHAYSRYEEYGFCADDEYIYHLNQFDYKIYVYDKNGNHIKNIKTKPSFFRTWPEISKSENPFDIFNNIFKHSKTHYFVQGLYLLNKEVLLSIYKGRINKFLLMKRNGDFLAEGEIDFKYYRVKTFGNKLYFLIDLNDYNTEEISNPVIEVYEYKN